MQVITILGKKSGPYAEKPLFAPKLIVKEYHTALKIRNTNPITEFTPTFFIFSPRNILLKGEPPAG
jgi:hypothetical protein